MQGLTEFLLEERSSNRKKIPSYELDKKNYELFAMQEHDVATIKLAEHLIQAGDCNIAFPFLHYENKGIGGEIDLLTENEEDETWFEIKFRLTPNKLDKAILQYINYTTAFPEFNGRAYCVSCDGIAYEISKNGIKAV